MKNEESRTKRLRGIYACLSVVLFAASCETGVDDSEQFFSGVKNTRLESPAIGEQSFSVLTNPDGSESVKITWDVINGAGGYLLNVSCVSNPEDEAVSEASPMIVIQDSIVDGCSAVFPKIEDATYRISLLTKGNASLNNTDAAEAATYTYSALVPAVTIPAGEDIAAYIRENLQDDSKEQGFALEAGKTYRLDGTADFGLNTVTLRSTDINASRPTVMVGPEGKIMTQGGLKIKFINFDCTECTQTGLLTLSDSPDPSISTESLGYKAAGANQDGFVINNPVLFQECNIRNLKKSLLYGNKKNWSLRDFRITDCIIQLDNDGSDSFINLNGASNGLIKKLTIENSTVYNLVKNESAYFIRYSNSSNANPKKIFGDNDDSATYLLSHNTFCKTFSNKDFGNNLPNTNTVTMNVEYNIFYDVYRLNKIFGSSTIKNTPGNTIWGVDSGTPSNDDTEKKDNAGNPYSTLEDPQFAGPFLQAFDLAQEKGGVNFTPAGSYAASQKAGDPRWYE